MAFSLTARAGRAAQADLLEPNMVLEIDGVPTLYGAVPILEIFKYGSEATYGDGKNYGDLVAIEDQESFISFDGTTTTITQQVNPDRGIGTSTSSFKVALIDQSEKITKLITPGEIVDDILGRKCRLYFGFDGTNFPLDYIIVFRGIIDDINAKSGLITLNMAHPDTKKRQDIFKLIDTELDGDITDSDTTITLTDSSNMLQKVTGPDGSFDPNFESYIRLNDEIIRYETITGNDLESCTRGQFGTTAVAHSDADSVATNYRLQGTAMETALKLMFSGKQGDYVDSIQIDNFIRDLNGNDTTDSIFICGVDIESRYGLAIGDFLTTIGAVDGSNNVSLFPITDIQVDDTGSTIVADGAGFVLELDSPAELSVRSQFDVWPDGLKMAGEEVDTDEHLLLQQRFLSSFLYDFLLKDTIEGKDFIETQIYIPCATFTVPRKAKSSVAYHIGPIPGDSTPLLNKENIRNPKNISIRRSNKRHFENEVVFQFEESRIEEDKFLLNLITINATSQTQTDTFKTTTIQSKGLRATNQAATLAATASDRRLKRYAFGAEFLEGLNIFYGDAFNIEPGDIVIGDFSDLGIPDTSSGTRQFKSRLFEIQNKTINLKTGTSKFTLVDTGFNQDTRYGLISPTSLIKFGNSSTEIVIEANLPSRFGSNEGAKWARFLDPSASLTVRSPDFVTRVGTSLIQSIVGNTLTLVTPLGFTPVAGDLVHLSTYNDQPDNVKLLYTHMRDTAPFDDGEKLYTMI